jgi:hypothetical protein
MEAEMPYVLVIFLFANPSVKAVSAATAVFATKGACEAAQKAIKLDAFNDFRENSDHGYLPITHCLPQN